MSQILMALAGGLLIGLAVTLMLWMNGRVTGISGIINSSLVASFKENGWRWAFLVGLFAGGIVLNFFHPAFFENTLQKSVDELIAAGFLVGFGTVMGSGCTSGHGVCGISRFSMRSLVATILFILSGMGMVMFL